MIRAGCCGCICGRCTHQDGLRDNHHNDECLADLHKRYAEYEARESKESRKMKWKDLTGHQKICNVQFANWNMAEVLEAVKVAGDPFGQGSLITWWICDKDPTLLKIHAMQTCRK